MDLSQDPGSWDRKRGTTSAAAWGVPPMQQGSPKRRSVVLWYGFLQNRSNGQVESGKMD